MIGKKLLIYWVIVSMFFFTFTEITVIEIFIVGSFLLYIIVLQIRRETKSIKKEIEVIKK